MAGEWPVASHSCSCRPVLVIMGALSLQPNHCQTPQTVGLWTCPRRARRGTPHALTLPGHPADADVRRCWARSRISPAGGRRRAEGNGIPRGRTRPRTTERVLAYDSHRPAARPHPSSGSFENDLEEAVKHRNSPAVGPDQAQTLLSITQPSFTTAPHTHETRVRERDTTHQLRQVREGRADLRAAFLSTLAT
jgi:hypothetical protein